MDKITVNVSIEKYEEMLTKCNKYDMYRDYLINGGYISDIERVLFDIPKEPENAAAEVTEPPKAEEATDNAEL
jgi:hypothetical protein